MKIVLCLPACVLGLLIAIAGCSESGTDVPTVPVAGKITIKGQPLADAQVEFHNNEKKFVGSGKTDASGNFKLYQGAVAGENVVLVKKTPLGFNNNPEEGMDLGQLEAAASAEAGGVPTNNALKGSEVPLEFSDAEKSPLKFVVPEGGTQSANFDL